jgi:hypothetical protein
MHNPQRVRGWQRCRQVDRDAFDTHLPVELACAFFEKVGIASDEDVAGPGTLRYVDTEIGPDSCGLTGSENEAGEGHGKVMR